MYVCICKLYNQMFVELASVVEENETMTAVLNDLIMTSEDCIKQHVLALKISIFFLNVSKYRLKPKQEIICLW